MRVSDDDGELTRRLGHAPAPELQAAQVQAQTFPRPEKCAICKCSVQSNPDSAIIGLCSECRNKGDEENKPSVYATEIETLDVESASKAISMIRQIAYWRELNRVNAWYLLQQLRMDYLPRVAHRIFCHGMNTVRIDRRTRGAKGPEFWIYAAYKEEAKAAWPGAWERPEHCRNVPEREAFQNDALWTHLLTHYNGSTLLMPHCYFPIEPGIDFRRAIA